jgi:hypothetical protein
MTGALVETEAAIMGETRVEVRLMIWCLFTLAMKATVMMTLQAMAVRTALVTIR